MHYLIKLIVEADNAVEALEAAERDCNDLIEGGEFDWFDLHGRWGDSKAYGINSVKAKKLIADGMKYNRKQFDSAMTHIKYMMERYTDDQIYNEDFDREDKTPEGIYFLSRYQFSVAAGDSNCGCVYAVNGDLWGSRVNNDKDLKAVLNNGNGKKLWVVPVDFHN